MENNNQEALIKFQPIPVDLDGTQLILNQMENCICKIFKDNGEKGAGTGFFCKIPFPDKNHLLPVLITNNHIINENEIKNIKIIKLKMHNKGKEIEKKIIMDKPRKTFTKLNDEEGLDITIIEIKPEEDIINNFLTYDFDEILGIEYKRKSVYILHYPLDKNLVSYGLIKDIKDGKKISHYCNIEEGSSGGPILSLNNFKVIGIHYGGVDEINDRTKIKLNFGTVIKYAITLFNEENRNKANYKQNMDTNGSKIRLNNNIKNGTNNEQKIANEIQFELNRKNSFGKYNDLTITNEIKGELNNKNTFGKNNNNKDEINLIYFTEEEDLYNIFGNRFVNNNKNNISLIINGKESNLVEESFLIKGENKIELIIKNKITNLEYMFYKCCTLTNIEGLKNLNTKDIKNFSFMFYGCSSLLDINGLQNWDVSKANNLESMFNGCSLLLNLNKLQNWEVSNVINFKSMFYKCSTLSDINGLKKWDVSRANNFYGMFLGCSSLSNLDALQDWKVSNVNNFECMFYKCSFLSDIKGLKYWDVSKANNFKGMFLMCSSLEDINALENWNVSNVNNYEDMFGGCIKLKDINGLKEWKVSKQNNFKGMFYECLELSNINGLQKWNLSNTFIFKNMLNEFPLSLRYAYTEN